MVFFTGTIRYTYIYGCPFVRSEKVEIALTQVYWFISLFIVSSWISKFSDLCTKIPDDGIVRWSEECLSLYHSLEKHLGAYFVFLFSSSQVLWIFTLYMGITGYFADYDAASTVCFGVGYFIYSVNILVTVLRFSGLLEAAHQSLQSIVKTLESHSLELEDKKEFLSLSYLIKDIEKTKPLTGKGLFQIDRSILTGMVSVAVTYIIILAQFRMSLANQT